MHSISAKSSKKDKGKKHTFSFGGTAQSRHDIADKINKPSPSARVLSPIKDRNTSPVNDQATQQKEFQTVKVIE